MVGGYPQDIDFLNALDPIGALRFAAPAVKGVPKVSVFIRSADPRDPGATQLLQASQALMRSLFAEDECHFLEIDALAVPSVHFRVAERNGASIGCGALAIKDGYGEIKSMFTDPAARGLGAAGMILSNLETTARGMDLPWLRLETGTVLHAAHRLYERHGFVSCGPFGDYAEHPASLFYEKHLD